MQRKRDMKWVNGVLAMLFWWLIEILPASVHCHMNTLLVLKFLIMHEKKWNIELCASFPKCAIFITAVVANYLPNIGSWDIVTEQIVSKKT